MRPEALARTAAMNARLRDRLVPQPEPAPERPEWVRIVDSPKLAVTNVGGHEFGSVVRVLRWRKDRPVVPSGPLAHYAYDVTLLRHAWEPADPPTPEPPTTCAICDGTGSSAGRNRTPGLIGWSPCHSCGGSGKASSEGPPREWKVGDWFTVADAWIDRLRRTEGGYDANLTSSTPYRVERWQTGDVPGFGPGAIFDQTRRYVPASHMRRCDPPSDPQPGEMVAVVLSRPLVEWWATHSWRSDRTAPVGAACAAALSQEGGQR